MKYDTVLFDLDGTLLNTLDDLADSVNAVLLKKGYRQRTKEEVKQFVGDGAKLLMTRALPPGATETEILRCLTMFREIYAKNLQNKTTPYEGIPALLKKLDGMGIKTGVVSNKPDEATKAVCSHYFGGLIGAAIGDNIDRKKKPEPDNVYEAMKQLGAEKGRTLYVGDSDTDILTAENAGIDRVGVTWGYRSRETLEKAGAEQIIDAPEQLIALII
jgi:phosphoglycolate phosphatase